MKFNSFLAATLLALVAGAVSANETSALFGNRAWQFMTPDEMNARLNMEVTRQVFTCGLNYDDCPDGILGGVAASNASGFDALMMTNHVLNAGNVSDIDVTVMGDNSTGTVGVGQSADGASQTGTVDADFVQNIPQEGVGSQCLNC